MSRECTLLMRGLAIAAIVLHNFCHSVPGVTPENEFAFDGANVASLFAAKDGAVLWAFDLMSFFGWYGVPVFMFLTGYGLVMKYERDGAPFALGGFLQRNFLKLFFLMLPAVAALVLFTVGKCLPQGYLGLHTIGLYVSQLTMLSDLFYPLWLPLPGVYWYFGLTMEFYIVYALLIRRRPAWWMWALVAASIVAQLLADGGSATMGWLRHNATGWMSVLAFGVVYGRARHIARPAAVAVLTASVLLFVPSTLDPRAWQFSILACVAVAIAAARLSMLVPYWREAWIWLGRFSPMVFVAHPVAREAVAYVFPIQSPGLLPLVLYLIVTVALALVFRPITRALWRRYI